MRTKSGENILNMYAQLMNNLDSYENKVRKNWQETVPEICEKYLSERLFVKETTEGRLALNFHHEVIISIWGKGVDLCA